MVSAAGRALVATTNKKGGCVMTHDDEMLRPGMVRQGDVLLVRVDLAAAAAPLPREADGSTVLAHGEVTGHRHRFAPEDEVALHDVPTRPTRHLTVVRTGGL